MRVLLDTNILIDHLREGTLEPPVRINEYGICVITQAELLRLGGIGRNELHAIENLLSTCKILPIDSRIAKRAAEIGRTRRTKLPDLLIAATALEHDVPLITKNRKDFQRIPGLTVQSAP